MNILIIDDDALVCSALKTILESYPDCSVCASGSSGTEAYSLYNKHLPDICLFDIRMNGMTGLEAAEKILSGNPDAKILFLTTFSDDEYIIKALKIGARGYLLKQDYEKIYPALLSVMGGQSVFGEEVIARVPRLFGKLESHFDYEKSGLSERDNEIISLVAEGMSNKEIADKMFLSEGTVRNYLSIILEKLQLRDRTQLAVFYYKNRN